MKLEDQRESDNVEDVRGRSHGGGIGGLGGKSIGIGGVVIALVASYFLGIDPSVLLGMFSGGGSPAPQVQQVPQGPPPKPPADDAQAKFISRVLSSTEDAWEQIFREAGRTYKAPKLAIFSGAYPTACGMGQSAMGPFYCPVDRKVYLDMSFFEVMRTRFRASGDAAQAYVIAHEVGHHVQALLGITDKVEAMQSRGSRTDANAASVRLELQADCFAGVWLAKTEARKQFLEPGDVENALATAAAIGDDALQRQARGQVVPDSFTHGTSAQRARWLRRGMETGDVQACDTFRAPQV